MTEGRIAFFVLAVLLTANAIYVLVTGVMPYGIEEIRRDERPVEYWAWAVLSGSLAVAFWLCAFTAPSIP